MQYNYRLSIRFDWIKQAGHASWEPRHSRQNRFPGKQYVKLGGVIRQFSYTVVALHGCIKTEIQVGNKVVFLKLIRLCTVRKQKHILGLISLTNRC